MNPNRKIRVIKSAQRADQSGSTESRDQSKAAAPDSNRVVAGRVGAWVKEFQQRRMPDPRRAFANLFVEPALN